MNSPLGRHAALVLSWLLALSLAVSVGLVVVTTLGDSLRGRGAIGPGIDIADTIPAQAPRPQDLANAPESSRRTFSGPWGGLVVACHGPYADVVHVTAATGWTVQSYEAQPDDDVDAVFARRDRSVDVEVFCNQGAPILSELERNWLPSAD